MKTTPMENTGHKWGNFYTNILLTEENVDWQIFAP